MIALDIDFPHQSSFTLKITEKPGSRLAGSHSDPACSQTSFINIDPDTVISHPAPNSIASFLLIR